MDREIPPVSVPDATYRLQFNKDFGFREAADLVPYLAELGISHIYASPFLKARSGSMHGYDIVDYNALNPEVGTPEDFELYLDALKEHGLGQILDIVPNHMCIESSDNMWWQDVLENGAGSFHSPYFDINWHPVKRELTNKVLLPVLGAQFGSILESGELRVAYADGSFFLSYYEHRFPLAPTSYEEILSHRIDELAASLGTGSEELQDLQSIITAFAHLAPGRETEVEAVAERHREKEVTKRRLAKLYGDSETVRRFIDENVAIFSGSVGDPSSFDLLERLLIPQSFRVAHWRVATEEINYRRFFDINALGALRIELPQVFADVHRFLLDLVRKGRVSGFRVDHADGLYNPVKYFHQLQAACFRELWLAAKSPEGGEGDEEILGRYRQVLEENPGFKAFYVVGEKILLRDERVPGDWAIQGETGYSFINTLNHLFVDQGSCETFDTFYRSFTGVEQSFYQVLAEKKKLIMSSSMSSEINTLGFHLSTIAETNRHTRDFTLNSLIKGLTEVIAYFPVYRTYTNSLDTTEADREQINRAVERAKTKSRGIDPSVFEFILDVLTLRFFPDTKDEHRFQWLDFVMRFQQITGPVMAKGMEDTTFYVYNRLISLNEVGGNPEKMGITVDEFHAENGARVRNIPHALLASTTHDTKRSEDVRARLNVLTELPEEWTGAVSRWSRTNRRHRRPLEGGLVPSTNKEYHFYQTLVGAWPLADDPGTMDDFRSRIQSYMQKALREAKENTSWINPNNEYEAGVASFIDAVLTDRTFLDDFRIFHRPVAESAMYASLSMALLKMTSPGAPDFYQGSELWDLRLVDPDNRQPVDYGRRKGLLDELRRKDAEGLPGRLAMELSENPEDGRAKLFLVNRVLRFRREHSRLFRQGDYAPLAAVGSKQEYVVALTRAAGNERMVVIAPRFFYRLTGGMKKKAYGATWDETTVALPEGIGGRFKNVLTDELYEVRDGRLHLADILARFPVALLARV